MGDTVRVRWWWFAIALAIQVAIVGGLAALHAASVTNSKAVYLSLRPVDPRDPLRGDYVTVAYDIGEISSDLVQSLFDGTTTPMPAVGSTVYVPLTRTGKVWAVAPGVSKTLPDVENDPAVRDTYSRDVVFIRGAVVSSSANMITVTYGIEEYFIPEGTGATWPMTGDPEATARVLIDPKGKAQVQQLFLDGKPWP